MFFRKQLLSLCVLIILGIHTVMFSQTSRETYNFNQNWKFALGHACDVQKDFNFNTGHFSYLAKTGYGDGAASEKFDDRAWRNIQLPHDWCISLPLNARASNSHGNQAIGKYFPEHSIGWYRKHFFIEKADTNKRIRIEFEGVYRNSKVFVNGFFVGGEESGYDSFSFDITEYLNFGDINVIAVRVDATMEEGWFYEGAGIYRNVWLVKTNKLHIATNGTYIQSNIENNKAVVTIQTQLQNDSFTPQEYSIEYIITDAKGTIVKQIQVPNYQLVANLSHTTETVINIENPIIWSIENPYLYNLTTRILQNTICIDETNTRFGIRTLYFDAKKGFFLNGKSVKIKGVCVHQDHAGVGIAIPYELQKWRIQQLKQMGVNAIRTSHNPPSPDLLNICDEMGMLVMDELRLMGVNEYHLSKITSLLTRDRNHPSVFIWSLGNEEWAIEGSQKGAKIIEKMQTYAALYDTTRAFTVASSGGWDTGIGTTVQIMGYNYLKHGNVDEHHSKFPWQPSIGTEESNTVRTRGIYKTIDSICWLAPTNLYDEGMEGGWKFYDEREFLAGLFFWTGFDYHGEPTPYNWPAVISQFGILDLCGFPKDNAYYLHSWWKQEPVIHIESNWNRIPGEQIDLVVYSNCATVELLINGRSLGKKSMQKNGHIVWPITFEPGVLTARGYGSLVMPQTDSTKLLITKEFKTAGKPAAIQIIPHKKTLKPDGQDVAICTIQIVDNKGTIVPNANIDITFEITGNAAFIGVGNGNPSSHEKEVFQDNIIVKPIMIHKELPVQSLSKRPEIAVGFDDTKWRTAYSAEPSDWKEYSDTLLVMRGSFMLDAITKDMIITLFAKNILSNQVIYINGAMITANAENTYVLPHAILKQGTNVYAVVGQKLKRPNQWEYPNRDPGLIQIVTPVKQWQRKTFNGLAQIIVQSKTTPGKTTIKARAQGLPETELQIDIK